MPVEHTQQYNPGRIRCWINLFIQSLYKTVGLFPLSSNICRLLVVYYFVNWNSLWISIECLTFQSTWKKDSLRIVNTKICSRLNPSKYTAQKMKFSIKGFFSKYSQIGSKLWIWSHLLKKSLMENFIFCALIPTSRRKRESLPLYNFFRKVAQFQKCLKTRLVIKIFDGGSNHLWKFKLNNP